MKVKKRGTEKFSPPSFHLCSSLPPSIFITPLPCLFPRNFLKTWRNKYNNFYNNWISFLLHITFPPWHQSYLFLSIIPKKESQYYVLNWRMMTVTGQQSVCPIRCLDIDEGGSITDRQRKRWSKIERERESDHESGTAQASTDTCTHARGFLITASNRSEPDSSISSRASKRLGVV